MIISWFCCNIFGSFLFVLCCNCHVVISFGLSLLGLAFGRTDFSRIFIFEPPDFFADFLAGFLLLIFVGKSAQKNPPGKSPGNPPNFYNKNPPTHFCRLPRAIFRIQELLAPPLHLGCLWFLLVVVWVLLGGCCVIKSENWKLQLSKKRRSLADCTPCTPQPKFCVGLFLKNAQILSGRKLSLRENLWKAYYTLFWLVLDTAMLGVVHKLATWELVDIDICCRVKTGPRFGRL